MAIGGNIHVTPSRGKKKMNARWMSAIITIVTALSWSNAVIAEHDAKLALHFVKSVRDAAQVLDKAELQVTYEITSEVDVVGKSSRMTNDPIQGGLAIRPGMSLRSSDSAVWAANGDYSFRVRRVGDKYVRTDTGGVSKAYFRRLIHQIRYQALSAYYLDMVQLSDLVSSDGFKITNASKKGDHVEILFEHSQSGRICRISEGYLVCAPSKKWAILEYSGTFHHSGDIAVTITGENNIGESVNGVTLVEKAKQQCLYPHEKTLVRKVVIVKPAGTEAPRDQFFLAHYGLEEPKR